MWFCLVLLDVAWLVGAWFGLVWFGVAWLVGGCCFVLFVYALGAVAYAGRLLCFVVGVCCFGLVGWLFVLSFCCLTP